MGGARLPLEGFLSDAEKAGRINEIFETFQWISPAINPDLGKIEPPAQYKRDGLLAYADGTNWLPNGTGAKGLWRWDGGTSVWVLVG